MERFQEVSGKDFEGRVFPNHAALDGEIGSWGGGDQDCVEKLQLIC